MRKLALLLLFCTGCSQLAIPQGPHTGPTCYVLDGADGSIFSSPLHKLSTLPNMRVIEGKHYQWKEMVQSAKANSGNIYVVGYSAGAATATKLAAQVPVKRLYLIDISPPWFEDWTQVDVSPTTGSVIWWRTGDPQQTPSGQSPTYFLYEGGKGYNHLTICQPAVDWIYTDLSSEH